MIRLLALLCALICPGPDADALAAAGGTQPRSDFDIWERELARAGGAR